MANGPLCDPELVSILMPTYNRGGMIRDSIDSVIRQTYKNWELLIIDDGSNDGTDSIVQSYDDERIKYHPVPHCGVLGRLRNIGVQKANGSMIAFMDSDDLWREDKLSIQVRLLSNYDIGFALSNGSHFGELSSAQPPDHESDFIGKLFMRLINEQRFVMYMPSLVMRKEISSDLKFNEELKSGCDVDYIYRISSAFSGAFSRERLVSIRKHRGGMSNSLCDQAMLDDVTIFETLFAEGKIPQNTFERIIARSYYNLGMFYRTTKVSSARNYFRKYLRIKPFGYKGWFRITQSFLNFNSHEG